MAYCVTFLANYFNHFQFSQIPRRINQLSERFCSFRRVPEENRLHNIFLVAIQALSAAIVIGIFLLALPPMAMAFSIYETLQPPKHYVIESKREAVTNAMIHQHLEHMEKSEREFQAIEIRYSGEEETPMLNDGNIALLKKLQPQQIILRSGEIDADLIGKLETLRHYYVRDSNREMREKEWHLVRRCKIVRVVLPSNSNEMLDTLKKLNQAGQRVTQLYFTNYVPDQIREAVGKEVKALGPTLQMLITEGRTLPPKNLEAILWA